MKRLQILILAIFILPFALYGAENQKLPYDYIDNDTKMSKELAEYNNSIKTQSKEHKKELDRKEREPSGFILGAGGTIAYAIGAKNTANELSANIGTDYGFDILTGYKWFFTRGFGMRLYGDYNMRFLKISKSHNIALNYDLLFNWAKSKPFKFGMILGLHIGGNISNYDKKHCNESCNQSGMLLGGNIGFRFVIYDNSAIEILAQPRVAFKPQEYVAVSNANQNYESSNNSLSFGEFAIMGNLRFVYTF